MENGADLVRRCAGRELGDTERVLPLLLVVRASEGGDVDERRWPTTTHSGKYSCAVASLVKSRGATGSPLKTIVVTPGGLHPGDHLRRGRLDGGRVELVGDDLGERRPSGLHVGGERVGELLGRATVLEVEQPELARLILHRVAAVARRSCR